jgi:hypothetical protein
MGERTKWRKLKYHSQLYIDEVRVLGYFLLFVRYSRVVPVSVIAEVIDGLNV